MELILIDFEERLSKNGKVYYTCNILDVTNNIVNKNVFITKDFYEYLDNNYSKYSKIEETYFGFRPELVNKTFYYKLTYIGGI